MFDAQINARTAWKLLHMNQREIRFFFSLFYDCLNRYQKIGPSFADADESGEYTNKKKAIKES